MAVVGVWSGVCVIVGVAVWGSEKSKDELFMSDKDLASDEYSDDVCEGNLKISFQYTAVNIVTAPINRTRITVIRTAVFFFFL